MAPRQRSGESERRRDLLLCEATNILEDQIFFIQFVHPMQIVSMCCYGGIMQYCVIVYRLLHAKQDQTSNDH